MVRSLLSSTVLGVFLFAASANAATDTPAVAGGTVTIENGVQVIRGSSETYQDCPFTEDLRPAQTINIELTIDRRSRRGLSAWRTSEQVTVWPQRPAGAWFGDVSRSSRNRFLPTSTKAILSTSMVPLGMWTNDSRIPRGAPMIMSHPLPGNFEACDNAATP